MKFSLIAGLIASGKMAPAPGQLVLGRRIPRARRGDAEPPSERVGVPLVPGPADGVPRRRRHAEDLAELVAVARERRDRLLARREEHPALDAQPAAELEQRVDRRALVAELADADGARRVAREARDRALVVDDADGSARPPDAPDDAEALVVAADDDGADLAHVTPPPHRAAPGISRASTGAAAGSTPSTPPKTMSMFSSKTSSPVARR